MAKQVTLKDRVTEEAIYPITTAASVFKDAKSVYILLDEIETKISAIAKKQEDGQNTGFNTVTSLTNLPTDKRVIQATLSELTSLSVGGDLKIGEDLIIVCKPTANFVQFFPDDGSVYGISMAEEFTSGNTHILTLTKIAESGTMYYATLKNPSAG